MTNSINTSDTKSINWFNESELANVQNPTPNQINIEDQSEKTIYNNNSLTMTYSLSKENISLISQPKMSIQCQNQKDPNEKYVVFSFVNQDPQNNKYYSPFSFTMVSCPIISSYLEKMVVNDTDTITVNLPDWIKHQNLVEFFYYIQNKEQPMSYDYLTILKVASFFKNEMITEEIIRDQLIPKISFNNAMTFLEVSYDYLKTNGSNQFWIELFISSLNYVSQNLSLYLAHNTSKIFNINSKLKTEIINKYISMQYYYYVMDERIVNFILSSKNCTTITDALISEYLSSLSPENLNEIINESNGPTLEIDISLEENENIYQEIPINSFIFQVSAVISYKKYDNILNVNIKINSDKYHFLDSNIVTLISLAFINEENKQVNLRSISSIKNYSNVFKLYLGKKNYYPVKFSLYLKINYVHTALVNYFLTHFEKYYNEESVNKIGQDLVCRIIQCAKKKKVNEVENKIFHFLSNWLNDEVNMHNEDNLKELIELNDWSKVDLCNVLAFYIKYQDMLVKIGLKNYFCSIIDEMSKNSTKLSDIITSASTEINYTKMQKEFFQYKKANINNSVYGFKEDISTINPSKIEKFLNDDAEFKPFESALRISHEDNFEIRQENSSILFKCNQFRISQNEIQINSSISQNQSNTWNERKATTASYGRFKGNLTFNKKTKSPSKKISLNSNILKLSQTKPSNKSINKSNVFLTYDTTYLSRNDRAVSKKKYDKSFENLASTCKFPAKTQTAKSTDGLNSYHYTRSSNKINSSKIKINSSGNFNTNSSSKSILSTNRSSSNLNVLLTPKTIETGHTVNHQKMKNRKQMRVKPTLAKGWKQNKGLIYKKLGIND